MSVRCGADKRVGSYNTLAEPRERQFVGDLHNECWASGHITGRNLVKHSEGSNKTHEMLGVGGSARLRCIKDDCAEVVSPTMFAKKGASDATLLHTQGCLAEKKILRAQGSSDDKFPIIRTRLVKY